MAKDNPDLLSIVNLEALVADFKANICQKWKEVDPGSDRDWYCMSYGWGLGKGLTADQAAAFAVYVRYDLQYFDSEIDYSLPAGAPAP